MMNAFAKRILKEEGYIVIIKEEIAGPHILYGPLLFIENLIVRSFRCVVIDERRFNKT